MRLTDKMCNGEYLHSEASGYSTEICLDKLGQLEDIEEELGIDLIKLLSAKKVYYMNWDMQLVIKETYKLFINLTDRTIEFYENEYSKFTFDLKLENYGRNDVWCGWALTREELEK